MTTSNKKLKKAGISIRTEFSFITDDKTLAVILDTIADESVNISGYSTTRTKNNKNFVRLVPGTSESESKRDLRVVSNTLQALRTRFKMEKIITISNNRIPDGIPGGFSNLYNQLWCRVEVISFYLGEDGYIYLHVSNIKKALDILLKKNVKPCPSKGNK
ncbi:hypothetical protein [Oceanobacillus senegalensis]|uniref:hypothetical protein n=1 Tax=Oceanobacillus senegalensis TaxID=1936063 RepID=UPI000A312D84|nr:hypothetical protein [Oceanobacillus senegalensis]